MVDQGRLEILPDANGKLKVLSEDFSPNSALENTDLPLNPKKNTKLNKLPAHSDVQQEERAVGLRAVPKWLHRKLLPGGNVFKTGAILEKYD